MRNLVIILTVFFAINVTAKGQVLNGIYVIDPKTNSIDIHTLEYLDYLGFIETPREELLDAKPHSIRLLTKVDERVYILTEAINNLGVARELAKEPKKEWQINLILIKNFKP